MKKMISMLALLLCVLFLVGCGENTHLQSESTQYCLMDFYYCNYIQSYASEYEKANLNIAQLSKTDKTHVQNLYAFTQKTLEQELCVLAGVDYFESLQNNDTKLWLYSFKIGEDEISINVENMPITAERRVDLYKNDSLELSIEIIISKDNGIYNVTYQYQNKTSKMVVDFNRTSGLLNISFTSRVPLTLEEEVYQEFTINKRIYQLGSNIKYFDTSYAIINTTGKQNGGNYSVEGYVQNIQGKLKFSCQLEERADYDITSLTQNDLVCHLANDANSIIFESDENIAEASDRYKWNTFGDASSWKNLVG